MAPSSQTTTLAAANHNAACLRRGNGRPIRCQLSGPCDQSALCLEPLESRAANEVSVWASRSAGRANERPVWLR